MGWVVNATPQMLYHREGPNAHCVGGWVGPRTDLDSCGKSRPQPGFDPWTVHPVASRYTDCAILARKKILLGTANVGDWMSVSSLKRTGVI
jgi:hypothetical protein